MRRLSFLIASCLWAGAARGADKPVLAPAEPWVVVAPLTPAPALGEAPERQLLLDEQTRFDPGAVATYNEVRILVQTPQGLDAAGTIALNWNPDIETLTVHRLSLLRGQTTIDLLKTQSFTVLRRERDLDAAVLSGVLTATLQPEGLQVGDVVDLAYTLTARDPALGGHSEAIVNGLANASIDRLRVRAIWSAPKTVRWRASDGLAAPKVEHAGATTQLALEMRDVQPQTLPKGAPARFLYGRELEFSDFSTWAEVSALFAPLYAKASSLGADSEVKAEAATIRAASSDPRKQAALALALVQDKVRYLFLGMNDGGLAPASADETWTRRFGDCKGKTVLLLALLHELGIEAIPALVSTTHGDGLEARLPAVWPFDHVIVRASIGGAVYWLDGTRGGDRDLADVAIPPYHWALPIQAAGGALTPLTPIPPTRPQSMVTLDLDASRGLDAPATAKGSVVFGGDAATAIARQLAEVPHASLEKIERTIWTKFYDFIEPKTVTAVFDPATGEERLTMEGTANLDWSAPAGSSSRRFVLNGANRDVRIDATRDPGPHADAPFAVDGYPGFEEVRASVALPRDGAGFVVEGSDIDLTTGGMRVVRKAAIDKGVFHMDFTVRTLAPEVSAAEAASAAKSLNALAADQVYIRAPASYAATAADSAARLAAQPSTAPGFVDRGAAHADLGQFDAAIADFDKAVALDPKLASAFANRGISRFWKRDFAGAKSDLDTAASLDPRSIYVWHGEGLLAEQDGRFAEAADFYGRAIDQTPDDLFALERRARVRAQMEQFDGALADSAAVLRLAPRRYDVRRLRAELFAMRGTPDKAVGELDAALAADPGNPAVRLMRAEAFSALGRPADAIKEADLAIAAKPSAPAYLERARVRPETDLAGRRADLAAALKLQPDDAAAAADEARFLVETKAYGAAVAVLTRAIVAQPAQSVHLLVERGRAYALAGDATRARADFAKARAGAVDRTETMNDLCWNQATSGFDLETARRDCATALALSPRSAAIIDSDAFVLLRLGRLDESLAEYDRALAISPHQAASLFGRGAVKIRQGDTVGGRTDQARALQLDATIRRSFADWGVS